MPFHGITSKIKEHTPTRAPRRVEGALPSTEHIRVLNADDHEFPAVYDWAAAFPPPVPRQLPPALASLIDAAGSAMGCPPEHIQALRVRALDEPVAVERFCLAVHEERGNTPRLDPLIAARSEHTVAFWIEGLAGKAVFCAQLTAALQPYDGKTLATHEAARSPFPDYVPETFAAAKLLPRNLGCRDLAPAGIVAQSDALPIVPSSFSPWEGPAPFDMCPPKPFKLIAVDAETGPLDSIPKLLDGYGDDDWGLVDI